MTREEIKYASKDYVNYLLDKQEYHNEIYTEYDIREAFEKGAMFVYNNSDLSSLWHDTSEEPEGDYCDVMYQDENGCCWIESKADIMQLYDTWNEFTEVEMIIRWAYVSDLLPKGKINYDR